MTNSLWVAWLLAVACICITVALGLVVIIGSPHNAAHLLGWADVTTGGALIILTVARSRP